MANKNGFDHPCKDACSGWKQGHERGRDEALEEAAKMLEGEAYFVSREHYGADFQDARYECAKAIRNLKSDAERAAGQDP